MQKLILKKCKSGMGVFANKDIKKGDRILNFSGKILDEDEISNDYEDERCVQIEERTYIGPSGKYDDFVNHSCNPNCGLKNIKGKIFLIALKKIKKNMELSFDYSTWADYNPNDGIQWTMKCNCCSKNCRNIVRDFRYLPKKIKQKYEKLGIVPNYILKKFKYT